MGKYSLVLRLLILLNTPVTRFKNTLRCHSLTFDLHLTELQTHFGPASECEGAEKEDEVDEEEFGPVLAPHADESGTTADPTHSAVCALNSGHSQEHQRSHHQLGAQLGRLKQETNRCGSQPHNH